MTDVKSLEYRGGYPYWIEFDDGLSGEICFERYLDRGFVFEPLRDMAFFRSARVEGGTIAWPSGADIAPETLYQEIERAGKPGSLAAA